MKKYQYEIDEFYDDDTIQENTLNEIGKAGWELVYVEKTKFGTRFYFKREIE